MEWWVDPAAYVGLHDLWRVLEEDIAFALSNEERQSTEVQIHVPEDEGKAGEWLQRFSGDCWRPGKIVLNIINCIIVFYDIINIILWYFKL